MEDGSSVNGIYTPVLHVLSDLLWKLCKCVIWIIKK